MAAAVTDRAAEISSANLRPTDGPVRLQQLASLPFVLPHHQLRTPALSRRSSFLTTRALTVTGGGLYSGVHSNITTHSSADKDAKSSCSHLKSIEIDRISGSLVRLFQHALVAAFPPRTISFRTIQKSHLISFPLNCIRRFSYVLAQQMHDTGDFCPAMSLFLSRYVLQFFIL